MTLIEARQLGKKQYIGEPCKRGHSGLRTTSKNRCVECHRENETIRGRKNPEVARQRTKIWTNENKERKFNTDKIYRENHPERCRQYARNWARKNQSYVACMTAIRLEKIKVATPPWNEINNFISIYDGCPVGHEVDHIVPIKGITPNGDEVSGLHVPWNLQYLTMTDNRKKNKRMTQFDYEIACSLEKIIL